MKGTAVYHSPFGKMQLDWEDGAVTALQLAPFGICEGTPNELTARVFRQLDEYFSGTRRTFDFPCRLRGDETGAAAARADGRRGGYPERSLGCKRLKGVIS